MELRFIGGTADRERARAIADLLLRNVPLSRLEVNLIRFVSSGVDAPMDADSCKTICRAASKCKNLRVLKIRANELHNDMMDDVAVSSSPLNEVWVGGFFSEESVASLARQLRSITTMTSLVLFHRTRDPPSSEEAERFRPIANVLDIFNFTLERVSLGVLLARIGRGGQDPRACASQSSNPNRARALAAPELPRGSCRPATNGARNGEPHPDPPVPLRAPRRLEGAVRPPPLPATRGLSSPRTEQEEPRNAQLTMLSSKSRSGSPQCYRKPMGVHHPQAGPMYSVSTS
jgi:hypothetical protein